MSPKHSKPIDDGPSTVLDLSPLNVLELATLLEMAIEAHERISIFNGAMWREAKAWREEVRAVFLVRFFEVN